jgi:hypothetical protein
MFLDFVHHPGAPIILPDDGNIVIETMCPF